MELRSVRRTCTRCDWRKKSIAGKSARSSIATSTPSSPVAVRDNVRGARKGARV